jgi:hypothetical protein
MDVEKVLMEIVEMEEIETAKSAGMRRRLSETPVGNAGRPLGPWRSRTRSVCMPIFCQVGG